MKNIKKYKSPFDESNKRTKEETIKLFKRYAHEFEIKAHRNNDLEAKGEAEAFEMAAFELERNTL